MRFFSSSVIWLYAFDLLALTWKSFHDDDDGDDDDDDDDDDVGGDDDDHDDCYDDDEEPFSYASSSR